MSQKQSSTLESLCNIRLTNVGSKHPNERKYVVDWNHSNAISDDACSGLYPNEYTALLIMLISKSADLEDSNFSRYLNGQLVAKMPDGTFKIYGEMFGEASDVVCDCLLSSKTRGAGKAFNEKTQAPIPDIVFPKSSKAPLKFSNKIASNAKHNNLLVRAEYVFKKILSNFVSEDGVKKYEVACNEQQNSRAAFRAAMHGTTKVAESSKLSLQCKTGMLFSEYIGRILACTDDEYQKGFALFNITLNTLVISTTLNIMAKFHANFELREVQEIVEYAKSLVKHYDNLEKKEDMLYANQLATIKEEVGQSVYDALMKACDLKGTHLSSFIGIDASTLDELLLVVPGQSKSVVKNILRKTTYHEFPIATNLIPNANSSASTIEIRAKYRREFYSAISFGRAILLDSIDGYVTASKYDGMAGFQSNTGFLSGNKAFGPIIPKVLAVPYTFQREFLNRLLNTHLEIGNMYKVSKDAEDPDPVVVSEEPHNSSVSIDTDVLAAELQYHEHETVIRSVHTIKYLQDLNDALKSFLGYSTLAILFDYACAKSKSYRTASIENSDNQENAIIIAALALRKTRKIGAYTIAKTAAEQFPEYLDILETYPELTVGAKNAFSTFISADDAFDEGVDFSQLNGSFVSQGDMSPSNDSTASPTKNQLELSSSALKLPSPKFPTSTLSGDELLLSDINAIVRISKKLRVEKIKIAKMTGNISLDMNNAVPGSGKTTSAIIGGVLTRKLKEDRSFPPGLNHEIVYVCDQYLVCKSTYSAATMVGKNHGVKVSMFEEGRDGKMTIKSNYQVIGPDGRLVDPSISCKERDFVIMTSKMLVPYVLGRRVAGNEMVAEEGAWYGNPNAIPFIDEFGARIGERAGITGLINAEGKINDVAATIKKYAAPLLVLTNAPRMLTLVGSTMVEMDCVKGMIEDHSYGRQIRSHRRGDGKIYVGSQFYKCDGTPVHLWSYYPAELIGILLTGYGKPLVKRTVSHHAAIELRDTLKRLAKEYPRIAEMSEYLNYDLPTYDGNSIADYAIGLLFYAFMYANQYVGPNPNVDLTVSDVAHYYIEEYVKQVDTPYTRSVRTNVEEDGTILSTPQNMGYGMQSFVLPPDSPHPKTDFARLVELQSTQINPLPVAFLHELGIGSEASLKLPANLFLRNANIDHLLDMPYDSMNEPRLLSILKDVAKYSSNPSPRLRRLAKGKSGPIADAYSFFEAFNDRKCYCDFVTTKGVTPVSGKIKRMGYDSYKIGDVHVPSGIHYRGLTSIETPAVMHEPSTVFGRIVHEYQKNNGEVTIVLDPNPHEVALQLISEIMGKTQDEAIAYANSKIAQCRYDFEKKSQAQKSIQASINMRADRGTTQVTAGRGGNEHSSVTGVSAAERFLQLEAALDVSDPNVNPYSGLPYFLQIDDTKDEQLTNKEIRRQGAREKYEFESDLEMFIASFGILVFSTEDQEYATKKKYDYLEENFKNTSIRMIIFDMIGAFGLNIPRATGAIITPRSSEAYSVQILEQFACRVGRIGMSDTAGVYSDNLTYFRLANESAYIRDHLMFPAIYTICEELEDDKQQLNEFSDSTDRHAAAQYTSALDTFTKNVLHIPFPYRSPGLWRAIETSETIMESEMELMNASGNTIISHMSKLFSDALKRQGFGNRDCSLLPFFFAGVYEALCVKTNFTHQIVTRELLSEIKNTCQAFSQARDRTNFGYYGKFLKATNASSTTVAELVIGKITENEIAKLNRKSGLKSFNVETGKHDDSGIEMSIAKKHQNTGVSAMIQKALLKTRK